MLAELMRLKYGVAIAGAHGKTTTTSMVATVLAAGGIDPTVVIGGKLNSLGSNAKLGQGEFLVAEADESDGSFLKLSPTIAVVTNIDEEHLDYYKDINEIKDAFLAFINKVPFYGVAILCLDQKTHPVAPPKVEKRYLTYGTSTQADYQAKDVTLLPLGSKFRVADPAGDLGWFELAVPGMHNVSNGLAAIAVARELEIDLEVIAGRSGSLAACSGASRSRGGEGRPRRGRLRPSPTEVRATLAAAKAALGRRSSACSSPTAYTRTRHQLEEFFTAFNQADKVIILDIYAAGEQPIPGVSGQSVYEGIRNYGHKDAAYIGSREQAIQHLAATLRPGDLLLTLGAGDVWKLGEAVLEELKKMKLRTCGER